jgi:DNA invertase Pin-like site-specific DNA recombinase
MSEFLVPVTVRLTPDAYRLWRRRADAYGVEVGTVLSEVAEQSARRRLATIVPPREKRQRGYRWLTTAERATARELYATGTPRQAIAERFGCGLSTIYNHTRDVERIQS